MEPAGSRGLAAASAHAYNVEMARARSNLKLLTGKKVNWTLQVSSIDNRGVVHFAEEAGVKPLPDATSGQPAMSIQFVRMPDFARGQEAAFKPGETEVEVAAVVANVDTSNFPYSLAIKLNAGADAPRDKPATSKE